MNHFSEMNRLDSSNVRLRSYYTRRRQILKLTGSTEDSIEIDEGLQAFAVHNMVSSQMNQLDYAPDVNSSGPKPSYIRRIFVGCSRSTFGASSKYMG